MASERRSGLPTFWSTTLAKALVGDQPCQLAAWLTGHYQLEKRPRTDQANLSKWKMEHTAQLNALVESCKAEGWTTVRKEQFFKVSGQVAACSGKADLVTQAEGRRPTIWDIKSGTPRESDTVQVLIEMVMIPRSWNAPYMQFDGIVVYPDHRVTLKPEQAAAFAPRLFAKLKELGNPQRPAASPGRDACRFCDVSEADCPERFREQPDAETTEF